MTTMNERQLAHMAMIRDFQRVFKQKPSALLQAKLIIEESAEVLNAASDLKDDITVPNMAAYLKECADYLYVLVGLNVALDINPEAAKAELEEDPDVLQVLAIVNELTVSLIDGSYEVFMDDDIADEAFKRIHASNLTKLDDEGEPIFDEKGKIMKGPDYKEPDLTDLAEICVGRFVQHILDKGAEEAAEEVAEEAAAEENV